MTKGAFWGLAIPKALSFRFMLGMHEEITSPSATTCDPGEGMVYSLSYGDVIAPMELTPQTAAGEEGEVVAVTSHSTAFSHHLPELSSHHHKGLIIPFPVSRAFGIHSAPWAFALPWPR